MEVWELKVRANKPAFCRIQWCISMWTTKGKKAMNTIWPLLEAQQLLDLWKLIIKLVPSYLSQHDEWCQCSWFHAHCRPPLCHRHEEKLAWRHHAGPTKSLGTQTVSRKNHHGEFSFGCRFMFVDFCCLVHVFFKSTIDMLSVKLFLIFCFYVLRFKMTVKLADCSLILSLVNNCQ